LPPSAIHPVNAPARFPNRKLPNPPPVEKGETTGLIATRCGRAIRCGLKPAAPGMKVAGTPAFSGPGTPQNSALGVCFSNPFVFHCQA
jgi:hypothetical protein